MHYVILASDHKTVRFLPGLSRTFSAYMQLASKYARREFVVQSSLIMSAQTAQTSDVCGQICDLRHTGYADWRYATGPVGSVQIAVLHKSKGWRRCFM